jgi:hypothetical protein
MYDYDDMKCHAYDCYANACVTPECYRVVVAVAAAATTHQQYISKKTEKEW